jgi:hypothetical protein
MAIPQIIIERSYEYAKKHGVQFDYEDYPGDGNDGVVLRTTNQNAAVEFLYSFSKYDIERRCYQRLKEHDLDVICDIVHVPVMSSYDDELMAIEMDIVEPPFLLDFGKAYIDEPSPYTPEQLQAAERQWACTFPRKDLPFIRRILARLRGIGIEYVDPSPSNIRLRPESENDLDDDDDYNDFEQGYE